MMARFGEITEPAPTVLASARERELKEWVTRRQQLVEMLTAEKNRRQQVRGRAKDEVKEHIDWLEERIKQPKALVCSSPAAFWCCSQNWGSFRILRAALAGLAPYNYDSGRYRAMVRHHQLWDDTQVTACWQTS